MFVLQYTALCRYNSSSTKTLVKVTSKIVLFSTFCVWVCGEMRVIERVSLVSCCIILHLIPFKQFLSLHLELVDIEYIPKILVCALHRHHHQSPRVIGMQSHPHHCKWVLESEIRSSNLYSKLPTH